MKNTGSSALPVTGSAPPQVTVDLISGLNRRVTQPEHDVLEALVLAADHPERDRVAEGMRRDVTRITPTGASNIWLDIGLLGGLLDQPPHGGLTHAIGLAAWEDGLSRLPRARSIAAELSGGIG